MKRLARIWPNWRAEMANAVYPSWKEALVTGGSNAQLNGSGTTGVYVVLVDTNTYTYSAAHQFYSDITGIVGTEQEIGATKTYTNGVFYGPNITFPTVTGPTVEALVFFIKNAGANTTWRLVTFLDSGFTGLPVTPNGRDILITWNASGIFAL